MAHDGKRAEAGGEGDGPAGDDRARGGLTGFYDRISSTC
jgi:hypothetical protein